MTKPRTASEIYCERRKAEMTASLKLFVSAGTSTKPATAAPANTQHPIPSAGAAPLSIEEEFNLTGGLVF